MSRADVDLDVLIARIGARTVAHGTCIIWTGDTAAHIRIGRRLYHVHRVVYALRRGDTLRARQRLTQTCSTAGCIWHWEAHT